MEGKPQSAVPTGAPTRAIGASQLSADLPSYRNARLMEVRPYSCAGSACAMKTFSICQLRIRLSFREAPCGRQSSATYVAAATAPSRTCATIADHAYS